MIAKRRAVFAIVSAGAVLATLDQFIANVALPSIRHSLHGSIPALSWVLNGYSIVFAALLVPAGRIADRNGSKGTFVFGVVLFSSASAACAAAGTLDQLIAARVVQALGAALLVPSSLGVLLATYEDQLGGTGAVLAGVVQGRRGCERCPVRLQVGLSARASSRSTSVAARWSRRLRRTPRRRPRRCTHAPPLTAPYLVRSIPWRSSCPRWGRSWSRWTSRSPTRCSRRFEAISGEPAQALSPGGSLRHTGGTRLICPLRRPV